jgi:hypothetical protein
VVTGAALWWVWLLPVVLGAPWIAAIAWFWRRAKPDDGAVPPSAAELARRRLWAP